MKTIFRYTNVGLLAAAIMAIGALSGIAQNRCEDADGMQALNTKFQDNYAKGLAERKVAVEAGKQYIEKYGSCEPAKEFVEYLNKYLPGIEKKIAADEAKAATDALYNRFNASVKASNFDETYASGKDILAKESDQLDVIISLGSIGYDESYAGRFKYNDETIRYAKMAIAALESGKPAKTYGLYQWTYKSKENAIGWLNYTIGYITQVAMKDKKVALPYLYKATTANSETNKNPIPYELIGGYYFDELNKITEQIQAKAKLQVATDTPEVAKQKVDEIKGLVALANGTAERAMDAFSRAYTLGVAKPYKDKMHKNLEDAYKLRFAKTAGLDEWIAETVKKAMPNPLTAVTPISDPEPVETTTGTGVGAANGSGVSGATGTGIGNANGSGAGNANGTGVGGAKPATRTPATKPAAKPANTTKTATPIKPQAKVIKPVAKKKGI